MEKLACPFPKHLYTNRGWQIGKGGGGEGGKREGGREGERDYIK